MAKDCYIKMEHVDMSYPSNIYNASSIKQELFSFLRREKKRTLLKDVHALCDFSLDARDGDRIGVIGHNGAGKSTLLKTIAGIYPIEHGTIELQGKIRALFDISLGFDLESTGRENIMYRSLLLGASPEEVKDKMDEIIAFADIGEFIDFPIRAYSTGMAVRLAFAVSTCISGEILLLDEILGAGDAAFMGKARNRILEMMDESQLMVFVTHDLTSMQQVCNRSILMDHGRILFDGSPADAVAMYRETLQKAGQAT